MTDVTIEIDVNGDSHILTVPARTMLADVIRGSLRLTGTHVGCEHGVCGACTVLVDDVPVRSCITLAASCAESTVITVEGLKGPAAEELKASFKQFHALQCGFCTSGMLISALDLISRNPLASEAEIRTGMAGNLCRCTGYSGIVEAIKSMIKTPSMQTRE